MRETSVSCHLQAPRPGTEPTTQAHALTRNQTCNLLFHGMTPNQLRHTGQGKGCIYLFQLMFLFSSHIYPEVELVDHMVNSLFNFFRGTSILFSIVVTPSDIPTTRECQFSSTPSPILVISILFDNSYSNRCYQKF